MLTFLMYVGIGLFAIGIIPAAIAIFSVANKHLALPIKEKAIHFLNQRNRDEGDIEIEQQLKDNRERREQKDKLIRLAQLKEEGKLIDKEINEEIKKQGKGLLDYDD